MKMCCKCKETKQLSEFNKNRTAKDGLRGYCKSCQKISDRNYNETAKGKSAHLKATKKYFKTEKGQINHHKAHKLFSIRHPNQIKAQNAVNNAITAGKLPRPNTLHCLYGLHPAEQYHHHKGYEPKYWLEVIPVCVDCHKKCHKKIA